MAAFIGARSPDKSAEHDDPDATAAANPSAWLPHVFATTRFARCLKCMVRDEVGSLRSRDDMQRRLQMWITQHVDQDAASLPETQKARKPLAAAEMEEVEGNLSCHAARFFLRPHYELEGLTVSFRLVSKLPTETP